MLVTAQQWILFGIKKNLKKSDVKKVVRKFTTQEKIFKFLNRFLLLLCECHYFIIDKDNT